MLEQLRPDRLTTEVDGLWQDKVDEWARAVLDDLGAAAQFELLNPIIADHLVEFAGERISGLVNETTREALRAQLVEGVEAGESVRELAERVREVFDEADEARAELISRTEVVRSSNFANYEAQKISGLVTKRKWVSTPDGRTRDTHRRLNGKEATLDEPFKVEGHEAKFPGGFGVAALDCNCRCTTVVS
ncbi:MAG: phage minor head protein, partial [Myxococcales bacterium]